MRTLSSRLGMQCALVSTTMIIHHSSLSQDSVNGVCRGENEEDVLTVLKI